MEVETEKRVLPNPDLIHIVQVQDRVFFGGVENECTSEKEN
jgi:hypothetical protein